MSELAPHERRGLVDPVDVDIHKISDGPIMDPGKIYLPAGKLSMSETIARERRNILDGDAA